MISYILGKQNALDVIITTIIIFVVVVDFLRQVLTI